MLDTARSRRRQTAILLITTLLAVLTVILRPIGSPVAAAPGDDDEGGNASLRKVLEAANRGFLDAREKLDASKKRQLTMSLQLRDLEARHAALAADVGLVASHAYRNGRLTGVSLLLESQSADNFWERATRADAIARVDAKQLRKLTESRQQILDAKKRIDAEVREQTKQLAVMKKRKEDASRALFASGGGLPTSDWTKGSAPRADAFPGGSGTVADPTTSGTITRRLLHSYQQARAAGFKRHTACKRSGGSGEHPLGRACDFSAATNGFEDRNATGGDKAYGDRLALFFVKNADRLGVLYVIWYGKIWQVSNGLTTYSGCCNAAATHKNHVHLSVI